VTCDESGGEGKRDAECKMKEQCSVVSVGFAARQPVSLTLGSVLAKACLTAQWFSKKELTRRAQRFATGTELRRERQATDLRRFTRMEEDGACLR